MLEQFLLQMAFITHVAIHNGLPIHGPTLAGSVAGSIQNIPQKKPNFISPILSAESALAYDLKSSTFLFQKDIHEKRKIASISKLMTAIVILENHRLDEKVIVPKIATTVEPVKIWLLPGEEITVENLLYALLIHSGNDAALTLAMYDSLTEQNFVAKMNEKARTIGLKNTHFTNATGLDDIRSYSSAHDVLLMSLKALEFDFIQKAVRIPKMEIRSINGRMRHKLETTNELIGNKDFLVYGLKTGNTLGAGPSLVALASLSATRFPSHKPEILTIVLGSKDRFQETKILLDWLSRAYTWQ